MHLIVIKNHTEAVRDPENKHIEQREEEAN